MKKIFVGKFQNEKEISENILFQMVSVEINPKWNALSITFPSNLTEYGDYI